MNTLFIKSIRKLAPLVCFLAVVLMAVCPAAGQMQTGAFTDADPWLISPISLVGTDQIRIDTTGNNVPDTLYNLDVELQPNTDFEYKLSPTRTVLYSKKISNINCGIGEVRIFFQRLESAPNMTSLTPGGVCMQPPALAGGPYFYDNIANDVFKTALVVSERLNITSPYQAILWVDLINGGYNLDTNNYRYIVDLPEFAPSGNAVFIRHGYNATYTGKYDHYTLIDLCNNRVAGISPGQNTWNHPDGITAVSVTEDGNGNYFAEVWWTDNQGQHLDNTISLDNSCFTSPPPPPVDYKLTITIPGFGTEGNVTSNVPTSSGINCGFLGSDCEEDYAADSMVNLSAFGFSFGNVKSIFTGWGGDCSGTNPNIQVLMDSDKNCTANFKVVQLEISKTGPATVQRGDTFDYTLTYQNKQGSVANVVMKDTLPAGVSFISATGGGTESNGVVTWNLGSLAGGASGSVTLTVATSCATVGPLNNTYTISSNETGLIPGTPVTTNFGAGSAAPVNVAITSVPQRTPLESGDLVTHTIELTDTGGTDRICLRMPFQAGQYMDFDTLIDGGGGTMSMPNADNWEWRGDVPANGTTTISFTTRLENCFGGSFDSVILHNGSQITVYNMDGTVVGSGTPQDRFPVLRPIDMSFSALNLGPPQTNLVTEKRYQAAREGTVIDFQIILTNQTAVGQPAISIDLPVPSGITPVGNPPFINPTDPGAAFDSATNTITWSGLIAAGQTVMITFQGEFGAGAPCRDKFLLTGYTGTCNDFGTNLTILNVPQPPADPYMLGLSAYQGLYTWKPGVDTGYQELMCMPGEVYMGTGKAPNGDIWVAGRPVFRFNPDTLDFEIIDTSLIGYLKDAAFDDATGTVIFLKDIFGTPMTSDVKRYDPSSGQMTDIITGMPFMNRVVVDPDGMIAGMSQGGIIRIDPANPANYQTYTDPAFAHPSYGLPTDVLTLDTDGNYIIRSIEFSGTTPTLSSVVKVDRSTGIFTEIVPDITSLLPAFPFQNSNIAAAIGITGDIYLGANNGNNIGQIIRTSPLGGQYLSSIGTVPPSPSPGIFFSSLSDLEYINAATLPQADLSVAISGPNLAFVGNSFTYTMTVTNIGPLDSPMVALMNSLPPGLQLISITPNQGICSGTSVISCDIGALASGGSTAIDVLVTPTATGNMSIIASASDITRFDPDPSNSSDTLNIAVNPALVQADISVIKTASPEPVVAGTGLTYQMTVTNNSAVYAASSVTLTDTLPAGVTTNVISSSQGSCSAAGNITCNLGTLSSGTSATVSITATVSASIADGTILTNTAQVSANENDPVMSNNTYSKDSTVVTEADLSLSKDVSANWVYTGNQIMYTLTVINNGPSDAQGVMVTDTLPAGMNFSSASFGCSETAGAVTCSRGTLSAASITSMTITVIPMTAGTTDIINTASVSTTTTDPALSDNSDTAGIRVFQSTNENIDPDSDGSRYAYGENTGWINLEPITDGGPGVEVSGTGLIGWMWGENIGWISLSCLNTNICGTVNYGIANDGNGTLSGYAWSENAGWINFAPITGGVQIGTDGVFSGYAWGENIGWINFAPATGGVKTSWTPPTAIAGDLDSDGDVDRNDSTILLSYRNQPASACPSCDIDGDGTITVIDARRLVLMCTRPRCATQ